METERVNESSPAIFFDKDGTLIEDRPYNVDPRLIEFGPGAEAALRALHRRGFKIIVITNQSGIAHGYFPESAIEGVETQLRLMIRAAGAELAGFYYCPHHPDGRVEAYSNACSCRKPEPGLILRAAREHGVDLSRSWFVGDILHDIEAGRRAGVKTILLDNGHETEWEVSPLRIPHALVPDLWEAARVIINDGSRKRPGAVFREEKDVHYETRGLEGFEAHSLRQAGLDGGRLDDGTGDSGAQGIQSECARRASHVTFGS